jgi:segregation and condensation protein A
MGTPVQYKLEVFEGPLDLLLHLIEKNEIDIYNIPISEITDQYMQYLATMQELQLDVTSEFLVMAATLLSIKSKMLLPKPPAIDLEGLGEEEEADPRMELVQKLLEYRKYKEIAEHLREKEIDRSLIYMREADDLTAYAGKITENPLKGIHLSDLAMAFQRVLHRSARRNRVARIHRDTISVKERILQLVDLLAENGGQMLFSRLFDEDADREMIVVTFLALLELVKMRKVTCHQEGLFEEIVIRMREEGPVFDDETDVETDY